MSPKKGEVVEQVSGGPRARYREQVRSEVQAHAWDQIAEAGAAGLSLKAIAKQMGMTAPALYRYFAGRDELLTGMILSAYEELAEIVEGAADEGPLGMATALRRWALANPQRYLLLYGTPVPGYTAPPEATALATRIFAPVLASFPADTAFERSLAFWTRLHGVLSLELAGHFTGMGFDTEAHYDREVRTITGG